MYPSVMESKTCLLTIFKCDSVNWAESNLLLRYGSEKGQIKNPVMIKLRWLVLRASCIYHSSYETFFNSLTSNNTPSRKHAKSKPTSVSFPVTNISSVPHIYKCCALNVLFLHTIIYIHFIITIISIILAGMCVLSLTHIEGTYFNAVWWNGACWQVLVSFLLLKSLDSMSTSFLS